MSDMTYEQMIDGVNSMLTAADQKHQAAMKEYEKKIVDHINTNLQKVIDQTADLNEQQTSERLEQRLKEDFIREKAEVKSTLQIRVQNACILLAAGFSSLSALEKVFELEKLITAKDKENGKN